MCFVQQVPRIERDQLQGHQGLQHLQNLAKGQEECEETTSGEAPVKLSTDQFQRQTGSFGEEESENPVAE